MRYASIRKMDISNGEGVGVALFVQGCSFHCKGCFNSETWDFNGGKEWTEEVENDFLELVSKPYITRISILGGEPLEKENLGCLYYLVMKIKKDYPDKKIWIYSGYTFEKLMSDYPQINVFRQLILKYCDVLVDGQFEEDKKDLMLKFRGSKNQRVIDVQESLKQNKVILYCE